MECRRNVDANVIEPWNCYACILCVNWMSEIKAIDIP